MTYRIQHGEELTTLRELAKRSGINYFTLHSRFVKGDRGEQLTRKPKASRVTRSIPSEG